MPLAVGDDGAFSQRDLVIFLTFCVILVTLVGQGLTLPLVIRWLGLSHEGRRESERDKERELAARMEGVKEVIGRLDELAKKERLPADVVESLRRHHRFRLQQLEQQKNANLAGQKTVAAREEVERRLLQAERQRIYELRQQGAISDEIRRELERELDLEEARVARDALHGPRTD